VVPNALVGRETELDVVDALLATLETGRGSAIALVGEAGIGKTRLLSELIGRAEARNHLVLTGAGSELDRDVPFWVFIDAR
jgi:predicted ATPase